VYFICRMAIGESGVTALTAAATDLVVLKRNSDDVGWEYGVLVNPVNKERSDACFVVIVAQEGFIS
jgi:hypothetical protein